ncbi:hypothetical protein M422DRAFT_206518 [Sphaerobolus stellatus SS14]|uniref:ubiquitinyl hydrolase 1 n=1 Tax=Sphaerobolus stellatus (strain SS14) TaxID=990650 RepID=A0A0C9VTD9_SPHS4|nr:hypothetical protein M422DRAFT_206518 [Sphaerobolus stellatus SS14]
MDGDEPNFVAYLANHLFLPPPLPQNKDTTAALQAFVVQHVHQCAEEFARNAQGTNAAGTWRVIVAMLRRMRETRKEENISKSQLANAMQRMANGDVLALHIVSQNAGVILRRRADCLNFEYFQASPTPEAVVSTTGKLVIQFPAHPRQSFPFDAQCLISLACALAELDTADMLDGVPMARKAGQEHVERRDVSDIRYISELLGGIARAVTQNHEDVAASTVYIKKRVNDQALFKNAIIPWRRDPVWLVLRVALQTTLQEYGIDGPLGYKSFITFVLARALRLARRDSLPDELIYTMNAKIAIRIQKLSPPDLQFPFNEISSEVEESSKLLSENWKVIQRDNTPLYDLTPPTIQEIEYAKHFALPNSRAYLSEIYKRRNQLLLAPLEFDPVAYARSLPKGYVTPSRNASFPGDPPVNLPDVDLWRFLLVIERWITTGKIDEWSNRPGSLHTATKYLRTLIYWLEGISRKSTNPELFSRVFLMVLEVWVGLDKVLVTNIPLIRAYSPELNIICFRRLLLPTLKQMERLHAVEQYIQTRRTEAVDDNPSIFSWSNSTMSFAYRYYQHKRSLQTTHMAILSEAEESKRTKLQELQTLMAEYNRRVSEYKIMNHNTQMWTNPRTGEESISHTNCRRCRLEFESKLLTISPWEAPLPEDEILAAAIVFELAGPVIFRTWRDVTWFIARMYCDPNTIDESHVRPMSILSSYSELIRHCNVQDWQRVTIASISKSFLDTHYGHITIPCPSESVIKPNALTYRLYDCKTKEWLEDNPFPVIDILGRCTPKSPASLYKALWWTIYHTDHKPNQVIARQSECPTEISYHEWGSFGELRSGHRLQWRNIMLALHKGTLTFADPAVYLLVRQAAWQVEVCSVNSPYRESHVDFTDPSFGEEILSVLRNKFVIVKENWQEGWTVATISMLACRLHSLSPDEGLKASVVEFLQEVREILRDWTADVLKLLHQEDPDMAAKIKKEHMMRNRVIQLATACRSTYMLDPETAQEIFQDPQNVTTFVDCAVILQNNIPVEVQALPVALRYAVERDIVLSAEMAEFFQRPGLISQGLDGAIRKSWEEFVREPMSAWSFVNGAGDRWISCRTQARARTGLTRYVHLNYLDGTLTVDGRSIGNLPKTMLQHTLFQDVFPHQYTQNIVPSTMRGMTYQLSRRTDDYGVHFALFGEQLVIRLEHHVSREQFEFVQADKLIGDIPNSLLHNTIILYNDELKRLEFYPSQNSSQKGWDHSQIGKPIYTMPFTDDPVQMHIRPSLIQVDTPQDTEYILCPTSPLVQSISQIFNPLESSAFNLRAFWRPSTEPSFVDYAAFRLGILLPRYQLSFFVGPGGHFESIEMRGLSVSGSQSVGTLFGLENKLVLDSKHEDALRQRVIIPRGEAASCFDKHAHVLLGIPQESGVNMEIFVYDVDPMLQRLIPADSTLKAWYQLAYLHILTSSHQPDSLLGCTGLNQALYMLRSSYSFAFTDLKEEDKEILASILKLCPVRAHFPLHQESMEVVSWSSNLSPLSQSELLAPFVEAILAYGQDQEVFYPITSKQSKKEEKRMRYVGRPTLRERAAYRNARLLSPEYYIVDKEIVMDSLYTPACCPDPEIAETQEKERKIMELATYVNNWRIRVPYLPNFWSIFTSWSFLEVTFDAPPQHLNMPGTWLTRSKKPILFTLFRHCMNITEDQKFPLMFTLSIIAYRQDIEIGLVYGLLAVAISHSFNYAQPILLRAAQNLDQVPTGETLNLSNGYNLTVANIRALIHDHRIKYGSSEYRDIPPRDDESREELTARRRGTYDVALRQDRDALTQRILTQWNNERQPDVARADAELYDLDTLQPIVRRVFKSKRANLRLHEFATELEAAWANIRNYSQHEDELMFPPLAAYTRLQDPASSYVTVDLPYLFRSRILELPPPSDIGRATVNGIREPQSHASSIVRDLLSEFRGPGASGFHAIFADDFEKCIQAMEQLNVGSAPSAAVNEVTEDRSQFIANSLRPTEGSVWEIIMAKVGIWPSFRPLSLLWYLSFPARQQTSIPWRRVLIAYAQSLLTKQELWRNRLNEIQGIQIPRHINHTQSGSWNPETYPDWLLVQLDANIQIRQVQAAIANEMITPSSGSNTVMQLNMGEGKSSVIVPITSVHLADGNQLVRVIVPKPLSSQMFDILKQRVSGLSNRRIFYLPFNRNIPLDAMGVQKIFETFKICASTGGILLCQPEHILSFQLMGYHTLCNSQEPIKATPWLEAQRWIEQNSRDILDESDEVLNVRYQLIYTVGSPTPLVSERWCLIQDVLFLVKGELQLLLADFEGQLEVANASVGVFPHTRILTEACANALTQRLAMRIVIEEQMSSTPFRSYSQDMRELVLRFILSSSENTNITEEEYTALKQYSKESFDQILLLRGLFGLGTLQLCLMEKRWRVDYGLHLVRTRLAVPYRAKDSPAPRAEFAHPDVIIFLTCLSYYYGGLSDVQLEAAFRFLMDTDNPALRYGDWTKENINDLPPNLRSLAGLNLADPHQRDKIIFPMLRYNKAVIDFYLSQGVFPKDGKEFEFKLTTNAWDLARIKPHVTSGFSGTNDNRYLLPLSVSQYDGDSQRHTNAQVLEYLLQPENSVVVETGSNTTAKDLIQLVSQQFPPVAVLLDVGAQILELTNKEVAREWLQNVINEDIEAAIYCDPDSDEFFVITRDGRVEPLASSLYRGRLEKTLIYLDEARTRGTDFKFPLGTRAVATLGPKLMKDKLVQACMRMRQLGKTHSVSFFASTEIANKIRQRRTNGDGELKTKDILLWTLHETCNQIKDSGPLWASQGLNFDNREISWSQYSENTILLPDLQERIRERESHTLEELYGITDAHGAQRLIKTARSQAIEDQCRRFQMVLISGANLLEEQERELAHEKENERIVERVLGATPREHQFNEELVRFVRSGVSIPAGVLPLSKCLVGTSSHHRISKISRTFLQTRDTLVATYDFANTVTSHDVTTKGYMNDYLRPVQWILSSNRCPDVYVLISPHEANILLPRIRSSQTASLHIYSPRMTRHGPSFEDLKFFITPRREPEYIQPQTIQTLNIFAGQAFFFDRASFRLICQLLGLHLDEIPAHLQGQADVSGYVQNSEARQGLGMENCLFISSPVKWLRALMTWRAKGQGFALTHMGQILHGNNLRDMDF